MTSVIDLWRAVDPGARLLSGSVDRLRGAVRGVSRTRALPPHLPESADGHLLVMEKSLLPGPSLDALLALLREAGLRPVAVALAGFGPNALEVEPAGDPLPIIGSSQPRAGFADAAGGYLDRPDRELRRVASDLRLAAAEGALADPSLATPAGLLAAHLRRGVAVSVDGELRTLHPRPAGRALAARFAALHGRLLAGSPGRSGARQSRDGIHLLERRIRHGASIWLFDDLPFARIDEVAAEAVTTALRALLARPALDRGSSMHPDRRRPSVDRPATVAAPDVQPRPRVSGVLRETLVAVARANGRIAPAARALGVHRNTVLNRLRRASIEQGLDPRRPDDALRILRATEDAER